MKVFDNIISKKDQKFIKNNLLDNAIFIHLNDVSKKDNISKGSGLNIFLKIII